MIMTLFIIITGQNLLWHYVFIFVIYIRLYCNRKSYIKCMKCLLEYLIPTIRKSMYIISVSEVKEYCQYETFEASCGHDEIIVMTSALYGRMKIGRCVKSDFGFLGCSHDVMTLMDRKCSGRQRCQVRVVDPTFENIHPCNEEFKNYLETSYKCVKGRYG